MLLLRTNRYVRIIMTAFDPQLLGNLYATPAFQRDFGYLYEGEYIISAPWQTGLSMVQLHKLQADQQGRELSLTAYRAIRSARS